MDPVSVAIGVAATTGMVVVLAIIAKFGFGGESDYEQTIAIQKEVLLDDSKAKGHDKKKPRAEKRKKPANSVKSSKADSGAVTNASDEEGLETTPVTEALSHPHVEYDPDPVLIEESPATKPTPSTKKAPSKSILHNKNEKPLVKADVEVQETNFTAKTVPKDVVEIKHDKARKNKKPKQESKNAPAPTPIVVEEVMTVARAAPAQSAAPSQVVVEKEVVTEVSVTPQSAAPSSVAPSRKSGSTAKKASGGVKSGAMDLQGVMSVIQEAVLSKEETQVLVEMILARPSEDSWTTKSAKPDPLMVLRKQLEETQAALSEEQSNSQSAQAKIRELNVRTQTAEKNSSTANLQLQELQKKVQKSSRDLQDLTQTSQKDQQAMKEQQEKISQLIAEAEALRRSVSDAENSPQVQVRIKELSEKLTDSEQTSNDLRNEITRYEAEKRQGVCERDELKRMCDELNRKFNEADSHRQEAANKLAESERNIRNLQEQMRAQKADSDKQLQALRTDMDNQQKSSTPPATNGIHSNDGGAGSAATAELEVKVTELKRNIADKDSQLNNLNKQLTAARSSQSELETLRQTAADDKSKCLSLEAELSSLQADRQKLKDKNNDLVRKNWSLIDSLDAAETLAASAQLPSKQQQEELENRLADLSKDSDLAKSLQSEVDSLKSQLAEKQSSITSLESSIQAERQKQVELKKRLADLSKGSANLDSLQSERDSLKLQLADKTAAVTKLQSSLHDEQQKYASMSCTSASKLSQLEEERHSINEQLRQSEEHSQKLQARIDELSSELSNSTSCKSEDQTSIAQYKAALTAAESMLDDLGTKIDAEQQTWSQKLSSKDSELSKVKQSLDTALKQLEHGKLNAQKLAEAERMAADEAAKVSKLSSQLEEASVSLVELKKSAEQTAELTTELSHLESSLKDEQLKSRQLAQQLAAAMAANGAGDDSGTCV